MTDSSFSVGDEVVCVDASVYTENHTLIEDATYVITSISGEGLIAVKDKNGNQASWEISTSIYFYANRFRLIKIEISATNIETNKNWGLF